VVVARGHLGELADHAEELVGDVAPDALGRVVNGDAEQAGGRGFPGGGFHAISSMVEEDAAWEAQPAWSDGTRVVTPACGRSLYLPAGTRPAKPKGGDGSGDAFQPDHLHFPSGMISPVSDQMPADLMAEVGAPGGVVDQPF